MLNNPDFYPTPESLAIKMACMVDVAYSRSILEPSAGKGDLVKAVQQVRKYSRVDCIEKDPMLRGALTNENYRVIDTDFLAYQPTMQYDTIIMNPPFSNGVTHVLKAWNIMYNGDVIALVNAETVKNPHSAERKLLAKIIADNGTVEFIADAFKTAERKTGVEVALIHLKKRSSVNTDYFSGLTDGVSEQDIPETGNQLAIPTNRIKNMVIAYEKAIDCKRQAVIKSSEAAYYSGLIVGKGKDKTVEVKIELNNWVDDLRKGAWNGVISLSDFQRYATKKVRENLRNKGEKTSNLEFTESNVKGFLANLLGSYNAIIDDSIEEIFDEFTRYHDENRVHVEGWKSNDYFFVNKRVVLPNFTEMKFTSGHRIRYEKGELIRDIDRVMGNLSGLNEHKTIEQTLDGVQDVCDGTKFESEFFYLRFYKKGTMHLYFKDLKILQKLNIVVGRKRGWLPKQNNKIPEKFWLMNK